MQPTGLAAKTALITGAGSGIGRACAIALAEAGANIVINDLPSQGGSAEVAEAVRAAGCRALVVPGDAGQSGDIAVMFERALAEFGGVDVAVHSAYYSYRAPAVDVPEHEWARTLEVCLTGAFLIAQHAARDMLRRKAPGSIIFISSILAIRNAAQSVAYNAAKNGLYGVAYTMAGELAPHQVRVNLIQPGWIDTPGERKYATDEEIASQGTRLPMGRLGAPEEIANAVVFLASDAASYITGAALRVDGALWLPHEGKVL